LQTDATSLLLGDDQDIASRNEEAMSEEVITAMAIAMAAGQGYSQSYGSLLWKRILSSLLLGTTELTAESSVILAKSYLQDILTLRDAVSYPPRNEEVAIRLFPQWEGYCSK